MKHVWLRILALLCALLMVAMTAIACATPAKTPDSEENADDIPKDPSGNQGSEDSKDPENSGASEDPEEIVYTADIPADYSCGGETFTVYAYPKDVFVWKDYDWQNMGGITGERINDAVFRRTSQVEEELDVVIEYYCGASYSNPTDFTTAISAGEDAYDIGNVNMRSHIKQVQQGLLVDLASIDALDLDAPWWDQNIQSDLSIYDKFFCLTGDIGTMYKRSIGTILFNKEMIAEYSLDMPYAMVESGEWTIEAMIDMMVDVPTDMDGNDVMDETDRYGIIYFDGVFDAMVVGADVQYATRDDDGVPEMTLYSEHAVEVLELMSVLLYDTDAAYNIYRNGQKEDTMWEIFMDNRALFYYGELHSAEDMRATEYEFGIMPMPKYDEFQESYRHTINAGVAAVLVIPKTNLELERTAYILDALGAASKNILTPAYYDINLKGVISKDEESTVSLDTIIATLAYDMGYLYISQPGSMLRQLGRNLSTDLASEYGRIESAVNTEIANIVKAIEEQY